MLGKLKKYLIIVSEFLLDAILDYLIPYKFLSKYKISYLVCPKYIPFSYVFNQKLQRLQVLKLLRDNGVPTPLKIKIWWSRGLNNFGDELMPYLLANIAGIDCVFDKKKSFIGIGSTVRFANDYSYVWGSGIIKKSEVIASKPKCLSVRGPLTRQRLIDCGVYCPEIYGDPAMLFPLFYNADIIKSDKNLIAPHFKHTDIIKNQDAYDYLDVRTHSVDDIKNVINKIVSAPKVITSSLHVFIFCVAYKVPVAVFSLENKSIGGDDIKFDDFCCGVGLDKITIYKIDDKDNFSSLFDKARIYEVSWSALPVLESLSAIYPTPTLLSYIDKVKSIG